MTGPGAALRPPQVTPGSALGAVPRDSRSPPAWTWRTRRRPLPLAILTTGAAVLGYVLYHTFAPFPAAPFGWVALAAAGSLLAGAAILLTPGLLTRMRNSRLLAVTATAGASPASQPR